MAADVATKLDSWSQTEGSNLPVGTTTIGTNLDDNLRMIQKVVRDLAASDTIASAATTDLSTINSTFVNVTGVTTITALGTLTAGMYKVLIFGGALTLTYNAASLILPGTANITTATNDVAIMLSLGAGNWKCVSYTKANGNAVAGGASGANPTASSGQAAVNGVATTFLRSDGAPAIASAGVGQAQLKTTTGDMTLAGAGPLLITGPGGEYGFWPTVKSSDTTIARAYALTGLDGISSTLTATLTQDFMLAIGIGGITLTVRQRYVQASPPYDLGDGEIPLFIFALVDSLGKVLATYIAPEPPWANNGPTNIHPDFIDEQGRGWQKRKPRADIAALKNPVLRGAELARIAIPEIIEVTQALKQADMPLIPHPFQGNDMAGRTVVLLDPVSALIGTLAELHATGEALGELLHDRHILLDNIPLTRKSPPGVSAFTAKWKMTP